MLRMALRWHQEAADNLLRHNRDSNKSMCRCLSDREDGWAIAELAGLAELDDWRANHPAPCQVACPIHTDARGYVVLTSVGRFEEAFQVASDGNPLVATCGRACSAPCETACTRGEIDKP